jgi:hypothetical protein
MVKVYLRNPQLTIKALDYILKHGRNIFDDMINDLIAQKKNIYKEGWIKAKFRKGKGK